MGAGGRGEITTRIQKAFFEITKGERKAPGDWLTYVNASASKPDNNGHEATESSEYLLQRRKRAGR